MMIIQQPSRKDEPGCKFKMGRTSITRSSSTRSFFARAPAQERQKNSGTWMVLLRHAIHCKWHDGTLSQSILRCNASSIWAGCPS
eukprot:scaffold318836_cov76-Attheya_sp.AAC.2